MALEYFDLVPLRGLVRRGAFGKGVSWAQKKQFLDLAVEFAQVTLLGISPSWCQRILFLSHLPAFEPDILTPFIYLFVLILTPFSLRNSYWKWDWGC